MANQVFYLEHKGYYLGGVIVVVEESLSAAKSRIEIELNDAGVRQSDYNLNEVALIDTQTPKTVYFFSGDY